jgi:methionine-rich copper-binding protein CopC
MNTARISAALLVAAMSAAHAHSHLRSSTPADGSTGAAPRQVILGFSEVTHLAALTLTHGSDAPIKVTPLPPQPAPQLTIAVPLAPGAWVLGWRAIGDDGHVTHGMVHFTVAPGH